STLGVLMRNNAMVGPRYQDGSWRVNESIIITDAEVAPLQWAEMDFTLAGASISVTINGKLVASSSDFGNQINGLFFTAGQSRMLIGSVERLP
ncbi:MAG: hypothetical protein KDC38_20305, partial [Planctomycetes bacterium]|nr:hypothetical protein [Planctomycetota bacterium]